MSKQLKPKQWIKLFRIYESLGTPSIWIEYKKYKKVTNSAKTWFIIKYRKFLKSGRNMNALISMSGKSSKKGSKAGRPKNPGTKHEIWKEFIKEVGDDELANLLDDLIEDGDDKLVERVKKIVKKKSKLSSRKIAKILNLSKSTVCNFRNNKTAKNTQKSDRQSFREAICEIFTRSGFRYGRRPIARILFTDYKCTLSDRQVGRIMNENGLFCKIREARKIPEIKNIHANFNDLVLRDYDNLFHDIEILATDVTYILAPYDAKENNVYLSVIISHKTKEIIGWKLSMCNDATLVIDSFSAIKNKPLKAIVHSDHGACYTSKAFTDMLLENHWIQSMSRVGNSLDNRVVEFWFSIFKTELIYKLDIKHMSFKELEQAIANYIDYYNNVRIQQKLNWNSPIQYKNGL